MALFEQVNIGLQVANQLVDLRVPRMLKIIDLQRVLFDVLQMLQIDIDPDFTLQLCSKSVALNPLKTLADYGFGNGDQLKIMQSMEKEKKEVER